MRVIVILLLPLHRIWKIGRVIECAGLEIRYTPFGYRGFESLIFRKHFNKPKGMFHLAKQIRIAVRLTFYSDFCFLFASTPLTYKLTKTQQLPNTATHQLTNSKSHKPINSHPHQHLDTHQLISSSTYQLISTHKLTRSPTYKLISTLKLTNSPNHQLKKLNFYLLFYKIIRIFTPF